jgi:hypothetical protein
MLQTFEASNCFTKVEKLSVDTKLEPYTNASSLIELGHVKVGICPKLKKELEALVLDKNKVTRTTELKDMADALVGAIYNAQLAYQQVPSYQYSNSTQKTAISYLDFLEKGENLISL